MTEISETTAPGATSGNRPGLRQERIAKVQSSIAQHAYLRISLEQAHEQVDQAREALDLAEQSVDGLATSLESNTYYLRTSLLREALVGMNKDASSQDQAIGLWFDILDATRAASFNGAEKVEREPILDTVQSLREPGPVLFLQPSLQSNREVRKGNVLEDASFKRLHHFEDPHYPDLEIELSRQTKHYQTGNYDKNRRQAVTYSLLDLPKSVVVGRDNIKEYFLGDFQPVKPSDNPNQKKITEMDAIDANILFAESIGKLGLQEDCGRTLVKLTNTNEEIVTHVLGLGEYSHSINTIVDKPDNDISATAYNILLACARDPLLFENMIDRVALKVTNTVGHGQHRDALINIVTHTYNRMDSRLGQRGHSEKRLLETLRTLEDRARNLEK